VAPQSHLPGRITVRQLEERDVPVADHIMRLAFGTFVGAPDPGSFFGDASYVRTRWKASPAHAFVAEIESDLVGSNFATNWGSVGFFGPLTIRPDLWDRGVGKRLMEPVMDCFSNWQTKHPGLFTFSHSQKHIGLYQKFGFYPRFLTAVMSKAVEGPIKSQEWSTFTQASEGKRRDWLDAARKLTDSVYEGLNVSHEIRVVADQSLGDTILVWYEGKLAAFAVCHCGAGSEAGSGVCYVKFGAAHAGPSVATYFKALLDCCESFATSKGLSRIVAGVNTARYEAYSAMLSRGYRADLIGVAMGKPNDVGYNRSGVYVMDDWR
jgi:GNAT superfamily N-acetyltransferase